MIAKKTPAKRTPRRTHERAATAASRTLKNPKATPSAKTAAGSALSQTGRRARTGAGASPEVCGPANG